MANQIVKRLMAAGASPQRAQQFAAQFQKSVQAKSPGANLKPRDYDDAFDEQLDAASRQMFPGVFRPPALDDPQIDDYIEFLYPGQSQKIKDRAYKFSAPTFLAAKTSTVPIEKMFTEAIERGQSLGTLQTILASDAGLEVLGTLPLEDAQSLAKKLFAEYGAAQEKLVTEREAFLKKDQNYKYGLPDPKLKYGTTTNFKQGVVGVDTIPGVKPFVEKEMTKFSTARQANPAIAPAGYMNPAANVLDMVNKKGLTPNKDEQQRRFNIKYNR
jgi:hypothetical protein